MIKIIEQGYSLTRKGHGNAENNGRFTTDYRLQY